MITRPDARDKKWLIGSSVLALLITVLVLLLMKQGGKTPAANDDATTSQPVITAALDPYSFAPLESTMAQPGGTLQLVELDEEIEAYVMKLAANLGATGVKKTAEGYAGGGLKVLADGTWTYKNPSAKDPGAVSGCTVGEVCIPQGTGTLPPPASLPTPDQAMARAKQVYEGAVENLIVEAAKMTRDQWRIEVQFLLQRGPMRMTDGGALVLTTNGVILSGRGLLGKYSLGADVSFEDAGSAFRRIGTDGVLKESGVRGGPQSGETVQITRVWLTTVQSKSEAGMIVRRPAWAYEDKSQNVWVVPALEADASQTSPDITALQPSPSVPGSAPNAPAPAGTAATTMAPATTTPVTTAPKAPARPATGG